MWQFNDPLVIYSNINHEKMLKSFGIYKYIYAKLIDMKAFLKQN